MRSEHSYMQTSQYLMRIYQVASCFICLSVILFSSIWGSGWDNAFFVPMSVHAQSDPPPALAFPGEIVEEGDGTRIRWVLPASAEGEGDLDTGDLDAEKLFGRWEKVPLGGYLLPLQTITLQTALGAEVAVELVDMESVPWTEDVPLAEQPVMRSPAGETLPGPLPGTEAGEDPRLPESPVFVLREGVQRGERFVIIALSPFYADASGAEAIVRMATKIDALITQTALRPSDTQPRSQPQSPLLITESPLATPVPTEGAVSEEVEFAADPTAVATTKKDPISNASPPVRSLNLIGLFAFLIVLLGLFGLFLRRRG